MVRESDLEVDVAVIGGGIVGASVARELARRSGRVLVLEKESDLGLHASGRNSGVLHSGVFNTPGTRRSSQTRESLPRIKRYCADRGVPYRETGKVISARTEPEIGNLERLCRNAEGNGIDPIEVQDAARLSLYEPYAVPYPFLFVPEAGIVDSRALVRSFMQDASVNGARFETNAHVRGVVARRTGFLIRTDTATYKAQRLVNAAGLHADRIAWQLGMAEGFVIVPFRGDYYRLAPHAAGRVRGLIYPTEDPDLPFLGVHFTVMTTGETLVGPNAVIPPHREAYDGFRPTAQTAEMVLEPGFLRMVLMNRSVRRHAAAEFLLSISPGAFLEEARGLVRGLRKSDLVRARSGIRAQLVRREDGSLVDDFTVVSGDGSVHVLNAVSPTLTNSLAIGEMVAEAVDSSVG